jgi:exodeoxyribonuclease VII small subunit
MDEKLSFEEALSALEDIVKKLENGTEGLEASLALFEEGIRLSGYCGRILDQAEQRIEELTGTEDSHAEF